MNVSDDLKWNQVSTWRKRRTIIQIKKADGLHLKKSDFLQKTIRCESFQTEYLCQNFCMGQNFGVAPQHICPDKIQSQMIKVAHLNLGHHSLKYNTDKLMKLMGWQNINNTLSIASARLTHQLVNIKVPELLSHKFDCNPPDAGGKTKEKKTHFWKISSHKNTF